MLSGGRAREAQGGGLQGLPAPGGLLLGNQLPRVPCLAGWGLVRPCKHKFRSQGTQRLV